MTDAGVNETDTGITGFMVSEASDDWSAVDALINATVSVVTAFVVTVNV
jgi:hypothetical protein